MSTVLEKIMHNSPEAAAVLKQAGFHTDPDICSLTREQLDELFPGAQNLRLRRNIFKIIHKQNRVNVLLKEVKMFLREEYFKPAITNNERVVENLQTLKNIKTQVDDVQKFLDLHICVLEERRENQANSEPNKDVVMSTVLEKIMHNSPEAAAVLKQAGFHTDPDICSLTREQLDELFPGAQNLRLRRNIFKIIHKQNRVNVLLKEVKVFVLEDYFNPALTNNERVGEYLLALKNIKTQVDDVQKLLDAHICVLEDENKNQANSEPNKGASPSGQTVSKSGQTGGKPEGEQGVVVSNVPEKTSLNKPETDPMEEDIRDPPEQCSGECGGSSEEAQGASPSGQTVPKSGQTGGKPEGERGVVMSNVPEKTSLNKPETDPMEEDICDPLEQCSGECGGSSEEAQGASPSGQTVPKSGQTGGKPEGEQEAGFHSDPDICSLTREQLDELFPGDQNLRLRSLIFEIIHNPNRVNVLLKEVKEFILEEYFKSALTNNERVVENIQTLKNIKTQVDDVQKFLDLHICVLEGRRKNQANSEPNKEDSFIMVNQSDFEQVKMVVSGKTFGAHEELLVQVMDHASEGVKFTESDKDCKVIIVFCPISSHVGSDVDAALTSIEGKDDKPVILVLMHHTREAKYTTTMKTWNNDANVVLHVNVFYHETMKGLLRCPENNKAVTEIRSQLMKYGSYKSKDTNAGSGHGAWREFISTVFK